jgi:hypothetical protein
MKHQMSGAMRELVEAMVDLQIKRKNYRMTPPPGSAGLNCNLLHAAKHGYVDHLICWLWKHHGTLLIVQSKNDELREKLLRGIKSRRVDRSDQQRFKLLRNIGDFVLSALAWCLVVAFSVLVAFYAGIWTIIAIDVFKHEFGKTLHSSWIAIAATGYPVIACGLLISRAWKRKLVIIFWRHFIVEFRRAGVIR